MKFNFTKTLFKTLIASGILIVTSCSKDDETKDGITDSDPISSHFGEFVKIPDFNENANISTDLIATDNGLYVTIGNMNDVDDWIYRYDLVQDDILKGTWQKVQFKPLTSVDFLSEKTPLYYTSEKVSEHEIFVTPEFQAFETPVFRTLNMASGKIVSQEEAPIHDFSYADGASTYNSYGKIIKASYGQSWAVFQGETVSDNDLHVIKLRYGKLPFNKVCSIRAEGELFYTSSLSSTSLYALSYKERKLFIVKTNGEIVTKDLSAFYNSGLSLYDFKNKFRFSNTGVYFQFQDKVLKLIDDDNLTLFYTIKYTSGGAELGDFCVDNDYLFATDGIRKELNGFHSEVNIIPQQPNTSNQEILMDYYEKTAFFKTGELETSTNSSDKYIYVLGGNGKILVISKHYL